MTRVASRRWLAASAVAVGVLAALWAWSLDRPPAPRSLDAPSEVFSAERARIVLAKIARQPHMSGSAEHERVRQIIVGTLGDGGFEVDVQEATVVRRFGRVIRAATVRNILARKRGTASTGGVALASHYDSQQLTPGAGDDGAGVAATLEAVRALSRGEPLHNDLYVIVTDAEELGLLGARALVDNHPWWPEISVLFNFEARGSSGPSVMFETNPDNGWVVREFARADPHPVGSSLFYEVYERLPNDTDFSIFKRAGVTGLNFAFAEGADAYHRPTDSVENLSLASLQHHGEHALALGQHFGNLDLDVPMHTPDVVFFRVPGLGLVTYSFGWAIAFSAFALLFCGFVLRRGLVKQRLTWAGMLAGLACVIAAGVLAAGLAASLLLVIGASHHEVGSIIGRWLYTEIWYGLAVACIAVASFATLFALSRRRFNAASLAAGGVLIPLALAILTVPLLPGTSMLFVWPVIFAGGAVWWLVTRAEQRPFDVADSLTLTVCAVPVVLISFSLIWAVYVGLSISVAPALAVATILMLALTIPLFELAACANRWWLPAASFALAIAFTVAGVLDARPGPERPFPEALIYALDRESGQAFWATQRIGDSSWLPRFFGADAREGDLGSFLAAPSPVYQLAPAPLIDAPAAATAITRDVIDGTARAVRLEIRPALGAELINVLPLGGSILLQAVNGVAVDPPLAADDATDWRLQHFGRPPGGTLVLDVMTEDPAAPLELALVEVVMRLVPVPGVDIERPPGIVAHAGELTDSSLFRQVLRVE